MCRCFSPAMINFFYFFIKVSIFLYKWIELRILSLFSGFIERSMKQKLEQIGVVLVESSESKNNNYEKILENCKYDKVCSIQLNDKRILTKVANRGYIAMGEGYVNGDFNCTTDEITELITRCLSNNYYEYYFNFWNRLLHKLEFETVNLQTTSRAWEVGRKHYDLGKSSYYYCYNFILVR